MTVNWKHFPKWKQRNWNRNLEPSLPRILLNTLKEEVLPVKHQNEKHCALPISCCHLEGRSCGALSSNGPRGPRYPHRSLWATEDFLHQNIIRNLCMGNQEAIGQVLLSWLIAGSLSRSFCLLEKQRRGRGSAEQVIHSSAVCLKPQAPQPTSLTCWRGCNPHRVPLRWLIYPTCSRATAHVALLLLLASHSAAVPSLPGAAPGHSNWLHLWALSLASSLCTSTWSLWQPCNKGQHSCKPASHGASMHFWVTRRSSQEALNSNRTSCVRRECAIKTSWQDWH